jgi:hypothetical protein
MAVSTRILAEKKFSLQLVRSYRDDGSVFHVYIVVQQSKLEAFHAALKKGDFAFEEYGHVVTWGDGLNPPKGMTEKVMAHIQGEAALEMSN